jgi:hypothetical protein
MFVQRTNRFWSVSLEHTLFLDILKLFVNMCLTASFAKKKTHFLDLQIKNYGCLKFQGEVWAGRACAAANEKELTTCAKSGGQEEKKIQQKWEQPDRSRRRPVAGPGPPTCRLRPLVARLPAVLTAGCRHLGDQQSPPAGRRPRAGRGSTPGLVGLSQFF